MPLSDLACELAQIVILSGIMMALLFNGYFCRRGELQKLAEAENLTSTCEPLFNSLPPESLMTRRQSYIDAEKTTASFLGAGRVAHISKISKVCSFHWCH